MLYSDCLFGCKCKTVSIAVLLAVFVGLGTRSTLGQDNAAPRNGRGSFTPSLGGLPKDGQATPTQSPGQGTGSRLGQDSPPPRQTEATSTSNPQSPATQQANTATQFPNSATQNIAPPAGNDKRATTLGDKVNQGQWQQHLPGNPAANGTPQNSAQPVAPQQEITQVSKTFSALPSDGGQVWREYDIRPYTMQIADADKPEQAIVDWILKQTGTEMWFNQPLGILSATREKLIVYHTPEIQNEIRPLIDRFNYTRGQKVNAQINLVTVGNPNWRETAYQFLQPIEVSSPQVEAWLSSRENAALLLNELSRRSDYRDHASGTMTVHNGQKLVLKKETPIQFLRSLRWTPGQATPVQPIMAQVNEGYSLSLSLLNSLDGQTIETSITCNVDQIERLTAVRIPTNAQAQQRGLLGRATNSSDTVNLQIPQFVSWRLHERIRWPVDQVLIISCGVVATPNNESGRGGPGLSNLLAGKSARSDALLIIDYRGANQGSRTEQTANGQPEYLRPITPK